MSKNSDVIIDPLDKMAELGIKFCPCMDMEEKYCSHYKKEVEDLTGGFCDCNANNCEGCQNGLKTWNEDIGWYVDKNWEEREEDKKRFEHASLFKQLTDF